MFLKDIYKEKYKFYVLLILMFITQFLSAQCFPDRHNTSWSDGWISCETSSNPNPEREPSHWILYDLGYTYHLGQMHVWNMNAPEYLMDGVKTVAIDVSLDKVNWMHIGEFEFEQASGISTYEGFEGPNLEGYKAKYLLITPVSNWGGSCYGLSEIKVAVNGVVRTQNPNIDQACLDLEVFPNPVRDHAELRIYSYCQLDDVIYTLSDLMGSKLIEERIKPSGEMTSIKLNLTDFNAGSYMLTVTQNGAVLNEKLIKIE